MARLLIHSIVFAPDSVSTAFLYTDLAKELSKLGHEVAVLTTIPHYNIIPSALEKQPLQRVSGRWLYRSMTDNVEVWHVAMPPKAAEAGARMRGLLGFHLRSLWFAVGLHERFDVVIAPSPPLTIGVVAWLIALRVGAKSVYNVQEIYPDFAINQGAIHNRWAIAFLRLLERFVYRVSDRVVTIGERFQATVGARGISPPRLLTIPNFVDTGLYRTLPRDNAFSREHGLDKYFVVSYAGNIGLAQEWEPLLAAAELLRDTNVIFIVIGGGTRRDWLEKQIRIRCLGNVRLLGYMPREQMPEVNAASDLTTILMDPRVTADGFPSKIYTTMACARPTIAWCRPDAELADIIRRAGCGMVVGNSDPETYARAILDYRANRERLHREGESGRAFVIKDYSKEAVARRYDHLIRELTEPNV